MSKKSKIVILPGDHARNKGDDAIFTAMLATLRRMIPQGEFVTFSNAPDATHQQHNILCYPEWSQWGRMVAAIRSANLVIWGGGHVLQDKASQLHVPMRLLKPALALMFGKPVMIYAASIGPLGTRHSRLMARAILNRTTLITLRDDASRQLLQEIGVTRPPVYQTVDPAVALEPAPFSTAASILEQEGIQLKERPLVIIAPRRWFHFRSTWLPLRVSQRIRPPSTSAIARFDNVKRALAGVADYLVDNIGAQVLFVPMYAVDGDIVVSHEIRTAMLRSESAYVLRGEYCARELKAVTGLAELVIGVRLHSTVFSTMMGVPSIHLSYFPKGEAYYRALGQQKLMIPIEDVTEQQLMHMVDNVWRHQEEIRAELLMRRDALLKQAQHTAELAAQLVA